MMQQLEHKLANAEFDATMLLASKEKWKMDLKDERAKHKTTRKSLKKSRSDIVTLSAKVCVAHIPSIPYTRDDTP
jgi:hypothetical protein